VHMSSQPQVSERPKQQGQLHQACSHKEGQRERIANAISISQLPSGNCSGSAETIKQESHASINCLGLRIKDAFVCLPCEMVTPDFLSMTRKREETIASKQAISNQ
jgi:hypothetical protein